MPEVTQRARRGRVWPAAPHLCAQHDDAGKARHLLAAALCRVAEDAADADALQGVLPVQVPHAAADLAGGADTGLQGAEGSKAALWWR